MQVSQLDFSLSEKLLCCFHEHMAPQFPLHYTFLTRGNELLFIISLSLEKHRETCGLLNQTVCIRVILYHNCAIFDKCRLDHWFIYYIEIQINNP